MILYRALIAPLQYAVIVLLGGVAVIAGTHYVSAVHTARAAEQRVCVEKLKAVKRANPFVERYLMPSDPCLALQVVRGGQ